MSVPADHNIIQGNIFPDQFISTVHTSFQHHPLFYLIVICHKLVQRTVKRLQIHFCQKSQLSKIDSQKRDLSVHYIPGSLKKSSISAQNNNALNTIGDQGWICIMISSLMLSGSLLYFTASFIFF